MFQLEHAIENWRSGLLQNQSVQDSDIDELESHLRDETDNLMLSGLSEEEAFMVSTHRIGDQQVVGQEFAKVNAKEIWRNRLFWMLSGVFIFMLITLFSSLSCGLSTIVLAWLKIDPSINGVVSSSIYVLVFVGAVFVLVGNLAKLSSVVHQRYRTLCNVLWQCLLAIFLMKAVTIFMPVVSVRFYELREFGRMTLFSKYVLAAWFIVWPFLLAGFLLWLRPSRKQTAH